MQKTAYPTRFRVRVSARQELEEASSLRRGLADTPTYNAWKTAQWISWRSDHRRRNSRTKKGDAEVSTIPKFGRLFDVFDCFTDGFRHGFWTFRAFSAWFSGWFGEMGYGSEVGFRGGYRVGRLIPVSVREQCVQSPVPSRGRILRRVLTSAPICHHLPLSGGRMRLHRRSFANLDSHQN